MLKKRNRKKIHKVMIVSLIFSSSFHHLFLIFSPPLFFSALQIPSGPINQPVHHHARQCATFGPQPSVAVLFLFSLFCRGADEPRADGRGRDPRPLGADPAARFLADPERLDGACFHRCLYAAVDAGAGAGSSRAGSGACAGAGAGAGGADGFIAVGVVTGWGGAVCATVVAAVGAAGAVGVMMRGVVSGVVMGGGGGSVVMVITVVVVVVIVVAAVVVDAEPRHGVSQFVQGLPA